MFPFFGITTTTFVARTRDRELRAHRHLSDRHHTPFARKRCEGVLCPPPSIHHSSIARTRCEEELLATTIHPPPFPRLKRETEGRLCPPPSLARARIRGVFFLATTTLLSTCTTPPSNVRRRDFFWPLPTLHPSLAQTRERGVVMATTTHLSTSTTSQDLYPHPTPPVALLNSCVGAQLRPGDGEPAQCMVINTLEAVFFEAHQRQVPIK